MAPKSFKVNEIWVFVSVDPQTGDEGICGYKTGNTTVPMIAADATAVDELRPIAVKIGEQRRVELRRFEGVGAVVEVFGDDFAPAGGPVICPGPCGRQLFGIMRERGRCVACFPLGEEDAATG